MRKSEMSWHSLYCIIVRLKCLHHGGSFEEDRWFCVVRHSGRHGHGHSICI